MNSAQQPVEESVRLKQLGNQAFGNRDYKNAAAYYTKAIVSKETRLILAQAINGTNPTYFFNRAKCYKELGDYKQMLQDT